MELNKLVSSSVAQKTKLILIGLWNLVVVMLIELDNILLFALEKWESSRIWAQYRHIEYGFSSSICSSTPVDILDQFSFLGNRAWYKFIELDMSTGLDLSIPSSRPLTFPGGQSENGYRARWLIELDDLSSSGTYRARFFKRRKKREKMEIKAIITTWSTKSKTPSRSQFVTDKKHCVVGRLMLFWRRVF